MTPEQASELLELQRATVALLQQLVRLRPRGNADSLALTKRQAERLLGIHRSLLSAHVRAGTIKTVRWGRRERIPKEELDRILRDGLPELPGQPEPSLPPRARARRGAASQRRAPAAKEGTPGDAIRALEVT